MLFSRVGEFDKDKCSHDTLWLEDGGDVSVDNWQPGLLHLKTKEKNGFCLKTKFWAVTAVARKASKGESVSDGQAGQKTSEVQAKGAKKKHLHSPRLGLTFRKFFRHKVCISFN